MLINAYSEFLKEGLRIGLKGLGGVWFSESEQDSERFWAWEKGFCGDFERRDIMSILMEKKGIMGSGR